MHNNKREAIVLNSSSLLFIFGINVVSIPECHVKTFLDDIAAQTVPISLHDTVAV